MTPSSATILPPKDSTQPPIRAFSCLLQLMILCCPHLAKTPLNTCRASLDPYLGNSQAFSQSLAGFRSPHSSFSFPSRHRISTKRMTCHPFRASITWHFIFLLWPFPLSYPSVYLDSILGRLLWLLFLIILLFRNPCWDFFHKPLNFQTSVFTQPVWILSIL